MTIQSLPLVLRDLITEFAWGADSYKSFLIACVACEVNTWDIPEMFVKRYHMSWKDMCLHVSPLKVFNAAIPPRMVPGRHLLHDVAAAGLSTEER